MTLQDEQRPIDAELLNALIGCTPDTWSEILLDIERVPEGDIDESIVLRIVSLQGRRDLVDASDELMLAARRLSLLVRSYGHRLKTARYVVRQNESGDWTFTAKFTYEGE